MIFEEAGLSCNHRVLGSQLGLSTSHLDEIESFPYDQRMIKILGRVEDANVQTLSWSLLANVLRKTALKEISAATYIEHHCIRSPTASLDSSSSSRQPSTLACRSPATSLVPIGKPRVGTCICAYACHMHVWLCTYIIFSHPPLLFNMHNFVHCHYYNTINYRTVVYMIHTVCHMAIYIM